jgi:C4-dicarboxylate-specific signal transduction histidine kinase
MNFILLRYKTQRSLKNHQPHSYEQKGKVFRQSDGPGISAENLEEIFVPFFTTRENGSGIGLSISKQIMRAHGGNLKVRSVPDKETVFCLSFNRIGSLSQE